MLVCGTHVGKVDNLILFFLASFSHPRFSALFRRIIDHVLALQPSERGRSKPSGSSSGINDPNYAGGFHLKLASADVKVFLILAGVQYQQLPDV